MRNFPPEHWEQLVNAEARSFWLRGRNACIAALLQRLPQWQRLLEVGCGGGTVVRSLKQSFPDKYFVAADIALEPLHRLRSINATIPLVRASILSLPFSAAFDVVAAFDVIEHLKRDDLAINHLCNAAKSGGFVVLSVPQYSWLYSQRDTILGHRRRYSRARLRSLLTANNCQVLTISSFACLAFPALLASRLWWTINKRRGEDLAADLSPKEPYNTIALGSLLLEAQILKAGGQLPCGGSLLVVAQKR